MLIGIYISTCHICFYTCTSRYYNLTLDDSVGWRLVYHIKGRYILKQETWKKEMPLSSWDTASPLRSHIVYAINWQDNYGSSHEKQGLHQFSQPR